MNVKGSLTLNSLVQKGKWLSESLKLSWGLMMAQMPTSVPKYGLKSVEL